MRFNKELLQENANLKQRLTETKIANTNLVESEEKFRHIIESSIDGIYQVDRLGKITFINESFTKMFGYESTEVFKKHYKKIITTKDLALKTNDFKDLLKGATINSELKFKRKDGSTFIGSFNATLIKKDEMINGFTGFVKDLSDFKYMEEEMSIIDEINTKVNKGFSLNNILDDVTRSISKIYNYIACTIFLYNYEEESLVLTATSINSNIKKKIETLTNEPGLGLKIPLYEGNGFTDLIKHKEIVRFNNLIEIADALKDYSNKKRVHVLAKTIARIGKFKHAIRVPLVLNNKVIGVMDIACKSIFLESNIESLEKFAVQLALIINKVLNDEKLRESEEQFKTIVETTPSPMLLSNLDTGKIIFGNQSLSELVGFPLDKLIGQKTSDFYANSSDREEIINGLKERGFVKNRDLKIKHASGSYIWISLSMRVVVFKGENTIFAAFTDVTKLVNYRAELETKIKERTKKLEIALKKEKELGELKSKFVTMTSHEFRTPLAAINFAAGSVKKYWGKLDVDSRIQKLDKIENQVNHMTRLLDDILFIGKTESDKTASNFERFNFNEFIEPIIDEVYILSKNTHEIKLINKNSDVTILIDQKLGRNIFINLLNNAIKFSSGKKEVILEVNSDDKMIQIKIIDFGIGIKKENLENIFTPFYREENAETIQGTGLGLSIVKDAIRLSKGTINVESAIDKGTTFIINLLKK